MADVRSPTSISPDATAKPDCVSVMHFNYCIRCVRDEWETVSGIVELSWASVEEAEAALGDSWVCAFCETVAHEYAEALAPQVKAQTRKRKRMKLLVPA